MEPIILILLLIVGLCLAPVVLPLLAALVVAAAPIVAALFIYHWLAG